MSFINRKHSLETREKMSISGKGRIFSLEHRRKISEKMKKHIGWKHTEKTKDKMKLSNPHYWLGKSNVKISGEDNYNWKGGRPKCLYCDIRLKSYNSNVCKSCSQKGERNHSWKGGITSKNQIVRNSPEYNIWRITVFKRDNYTCQMCGQHGGYLIADHRRPFSLFPELRLVIQNGRTLCGNCHKSKTRIDRSLISNKTHPSFKEFILLASSDLDQYGINK